MNHEGHVSSMAFSPDGARVLTASKASQGYAARLWDANTAAPIGEPMKHQGNVAVAAFSPDGTRVLTGSDDNTARLWEALRRHAHRRRHAPSWLWHERGV